MSSKIHTLPPSKRFRLLRQHETDDLSSSHLPAKKRKETRTLPPSISSPHSTSHPLLPAKKRVWALPPTFDLNLEYNPTSFCDLEFQNPDPQLPNLPSPTKPPMSTETLTEELEVVEEEEEDGIVCVVCDSTDGDPSDPIVFCDGCDLMVHASCYGNPLINGIPEGDWFCATCLPSSSSLSPPQNDNKCCCLCPVSGGALKSTKKGNWAHLVCALYVPEVFFEDPVGREGIDCSKVPKRRFKQICYLCNSSKGCAIDCSELNCQLSFHVTCGLKQDLCVEYNQGRSVDIVTAFCKQHTALWKKQEQTGKFKIVPRDA